MKHTNNVFMQHNSDIFFLCPCKRNRGLLPGFSISLAPNKIKKIKCEVDDGHPPLTLPGSFFKPALSLPLTLLFTYISHCAVCQTIITEIWLCNIYFFITIVSFVECRVVIFQVFYALYVDILLNFADNAVWYCTEPPNSIYYIFALVHFPPSVPSSL